MSTAESFVIIDETPPAPELPAPAILRDDDLIVHAVILPGNPHRAAGFLNSKLPEFIAGILNIQFYGAHSGVALIRAPRIEIEKAKREGRL